MKLSCSLLPFFIALFLTTTTTTLVSAHGYLYTLTIDGKAYTGLFPKPNVSTGPPTPNSVIRQLGDVGPIRDAQSPDLNCGIGASKSAELVAEANPGSTLQLMWHNGEDKNWDHLVGPLLTYMASCGSESCTQFDPIAAKAKWFKIQQVGRKTDGNREWVQSEFLNGTPAVVRLPPTLAPGNYLLRHEIISLHNSSVLYGVNFYESCAQLRVGGSQTGKPKDNEYATFPGSYSNTDPGILDANTYDVNEQYPFPGPSLAAFVSDPAQPVSSASKGRNGNGNGNGNGNSNGGGISAGYPSKKISGSLLWVVCVYFLM